LGLGTGLTTPHRKKKMYEMLHGALDLDEFFGMTQVMENGHGIWNLECRVKSVFTSSLKTVSGELAKYKLDLVEVQEFRWVKGIMPT
jgi:hypothetical protein